jgi:hypothetical protein
MQLRDCANVDDCELWALAWWQQNKAAFTKYATMAQAQLPREPGHWQDTMLNLADAYGWAMMAEPDIRECEQQAMALMTACTEGGKPVPVSKAEARVFRIHKLDKMLKQLAETAKTKLLCLQNLNRSRPE